MFIFLLINVDMLIYSGCLDIVPSLLHCAWCPPETECDVVLSCISIQKMLCETGFIWYVETLPNSFFFGIRERQYQELPTFSGYMGSFL